jgi:CRISPR-associated protein Cas1
LLAAHQTPEPWSIVGHVTDLDELRGLEGINAKRYFAQFQNRIKQEGETFAYQGRSRRPPRDPLNALLSFLYTLLLQDCIGALEGVGLDPQIGYLHALRPGKPALALDLMEEFRPVMADRLALTLINRQQVQESDFEFMPGGAVFLNKAGRQTVVTAYQKRKQDVVTHTVLGDKMPMGLVIHTQARLLARAIRKDHLEYQPYLHK